MFWIALIFLLVAAVATLATVLSRYQLGGIAAIATVFGLACLIAASISIVETKHLGVVKSFGKPTGRTTGAGLQWTKPWEGIDDSWDATRQPYNTLGAKCEKSGDGSLWVQIAGQRSMCVRVQITYDTVTGQRAAENWAAYRPRDGKSRFESFVAVQVNPQLADAVSSVFRGFDPLNLINPATGEMVVPDLGGTYTPALRSEINLRLGKDIRVEGISWGLLGFDAATTGLISQRGQKILEKGNLKIDGENAAKRREIAGRTGVPAAVQQCLDLVKLQGKGEPGLCMGGQVALTKPIG